MKLKLFIIVFLASLRVIGEWVPFSPEGIKTYCIEFYVDNQNHWAVGSSDIYLYDLNQQSWASYFTILPVKDISFMDGENVLMILENNPMIMEEGIHYLNPGTGNVYALQYLSSPMFIEYSQPESRYYVGHRHGLKYSDNFTDWHDNTYFADMHIVDMAIFSDHYVVSRMDNLYGIYLSEDAGETWSFSSGSPMISDLQFDMDGKLYGVFPGQSWSSGLWSSNDYGETWSVEFWATGINCVGTDFLSSVFVGFGDEAFPPYEGIARWDSLNQQLNFMNETLPSQNINQITTNEGMSAPALFCCTDTGVYINYTYLDIIESTAPPAQLHCWPNPAHNILSISHEMEGDLKLSIFSADGKIMDEQLRSNPGKSVQYNCSGLNSGLYFLVMDNGKEKRSLKWIRK